MVDIGDKAPDFTLNDQNKEPVALSDFRGNKNVLLLFYPFTFTSVCGSELATVRDNLSTYQNDDTQVLAVSSDTVYANRVWDDREGFGFPILSDYWPHGEVAQKYGVFDDAVGCPERAAFVIDRDGVIRWTVTNPKSEARDFDEIAKVLADL